MPTLGDPKTDEAKDRIGDLVAEEETEGVQGFVFPKSGKRSDTHPFDSTSPT